MALMIDDEIFGGNFGCEKMFPAKREYVVINDREYFIFNFSFMKIKSSICSRLLLSKHSLRNK